MRVFSSCGELLFADGHFDGFLEAQPLEAVWTEVTPVGGCGQWPSMRGAHQLCFDDSAQLLYLHGGWDGTHDLGDLWTYSVEERTWQCICRDPSLFVSCQLVEMLCRCFDVRLLPL